MKTLTIDEAALLLKVSPRSLADKRYRVRLGVPARKVGRRLVFVETDLLSLLEQRREVLSTGAVWPKGQGESC